MKVQRRFICPPSLSKYWFYESILSNIVSYRSRLRVIPLSSHSSQQWKEYYQILKSAEINCLIKGKSWQTINKYKYQILFCRYKNIVVYGRNGLCCNCIIVYTKPYTKQLISLVITKQMSETQFHPSSVS